MPVSRKSLHLGAWLLGVSLAALPFLGVLVFPEYRAPWVLDRGHVADNLIHLVIALFAGSILGGWVGLLLSGQSPGDGIRRWWQAHRPLNWIWFLLTVSIYLWHNGLILRNLPLTAAEGLSTGFGRLLTVLCLTSFLWLVALVAADAAPRPFRALPWLLPILFPALLVVDALGILIWKTPLRVVINRLDEQGPINLARDMAAAGISLSPLALLGLILAGAVACIAGFRLLGFLSSKLAFRPRALPLMAMSVFTWLGLNFEKGLGLSWKSLEALQSEQTQYLIHPTPFVPPLGIAEFHVTFSADQVRLPPAPRTATPDIFFLILESTRRDALTRETAPFLIGELAPDCQQLDQTWSASNATQLSWFSIFHGAWPFRWEDQSKELEKTGSLPPAPWFQALADLGYRREARAVCDLAYGGMGTLNMGVPSQMDFLQQAEVGTDFAALPIPEREREIFRQARESLLKAPYSGNFQLLALDSPHYPYMWPRDFSPPFADFEDPPRFPVNPTPQELQRVKNRYFNAIAWADHQVADFVRFLKEHRRYDNALIIVTADHGEEFQEHGAWFHCSSLAPEQTAVPLFIKWPQGTVAPPQASASHLDLLPSLLDFFGYPPEVFAALPGRSLLRPATSPPVHVMATPYCGTESVPMMWRCGEFTATFTWPVPWNLRTPDSLHLQAITGPDGPLDLPNPQACHDALETHFPGAISRFFTEFRPGS